LSYHTLGLFLSFLEIFFAQLQCCINVDGRLRLWGTIEKLPGWQSGIFALTAKKRWQALDGSNLRLIQHLIQLENPPQIQMSGFVAQNGRTGKYLEKLLGKNESCDSECLGRPQLRSPSDSNGAH